MALPFKLVSADSHIVEPPDLWLKHIDKKFLDRAPRIIKNDKGEDVFICEGSPRSGAGIGLIATKAKYKDPEHSFAMNEGQWVDVPEPAYDPDERIRELDREGI